MTDKQPEPLAFAGALANELDQQAAFHESQPEYSSAWVQASRCRNASALLRTQHKQIAAYKLLTESQEAQLSQHRKQADKFREAIATLQSEREANAILTAALERKDALLRQALGALSDFDYDKRVTAVRAITKELAK